MEGAGFVAGGVAVVVGALAGAAVLVAGAPGVPETAWLELLAEPPQAATSQDTAITDTDVRNLIRGSFAKSTAASSNS